MISASGAEAHRFGRVRRNGYDPAEVDAVMARLTETLRTYEEKMERLQAKLDEADASADAIRRTFIAAEATRDEMLAEAADDAKSIRVDAEGRADEILADARRTAAGMIASAESESAAMAELAERLDHEIAKRRGEVLAAAQSEADTLMADAEWFAAQQKVAAAEEAERITGEAHRSVELAERAAILRDGYVTLASARVAAAASDHADRIVSDARMEAAAIVEGAHQDVDELNRRAATLRSAVSDLQQSVAALATITADEVAAFDAAHLEDGPEIAAGEPEPISADETGPRARATDPSDHEAPIAPSATTQSATATEPSEAEGEPARSVEEAAAAEQADDRAFTADIDGALLPSGADVAASVDVRDDEAPVIDVAPGEADEDEIGDEDAVEPRTYYQRSTGIPLSERIKIARRSS